MKWSTDELEYIEKLKEEEIKTAEDIKKVLTIMSGFPSSRLLLCLAYMIDPSCLEVIFTSIASATTGEICLNFNHKELPVLRTIVDPNLPLSEAKKELMSKLKDGVYNDYEIPKSFIPENFFDDLLTKSRG